MGIFKKGDLVPINDASNSCAEIVEELGSGGQGTVYRVKFKGKDYALKWYHDGAFGDKRDKFKKNLKDVIIKNGSPNQNFLWPLFLTKSTPNGGFGYLMNIRPKAYYELTSFFTNRVHFKSFTAQVNAVINVVQGFRDLHNNGYSYQDLNNGNFFINPENGDVLICDNDNVVPFGTQSTILGKQRYMAPEIVAGKKESPDKLSDRFSMSVILFRMLFINHPLEGLYSTPPCMTKEYEKKFYGEEPIFILDPTDNRNRPIPGADKNIQVFWTIYPQYVRDIFIKAFSKDVMLLKEQRIIEQEWLNVFVKLKSEIIRCPHCNEETFIDHIGGNECIECHKNINVTNGLDIKGQILPLYPTSKIMLWSIDNTLDDVKSKIGEVIVNPNDKKIIGILNTSKYIYKVEMQDGMVKNVESNHVVPIRKGFEIDFINNNKNKTIIV